MWNQSTIDVSCCLSCPSRSTRKHHVCNYSSSHHHYTLQVVTETTSGDWATAISVTWGCKMYKIFMHEMLLYNFNDIKYDSFSNWHESSLRGAGTKLPGTLEWNSVPEGDVGNNKRFATVHLATSKFAAEIWLQNGCTRGAVATAVKNQYEVLNWRGDITAMYVPPSHLSSFTTALPNLDGWENSEVGALEDALGSWTGFKATLLFVVPFNSEKNLLKLVTLDWSTWATSWAILRPSLSGSVWNLHRRKELSKEIGTFPGSWKDKPRRKQVIYIVQFWKQINMLLPHSETRLLGLLKYWTKSSDDPWWKDGSSDLHCVSHIPRCLRKFWYTGIFGPTFLWNWLGGSFCSLHLLAGYLYSRNPW